MPQTIADPADTLQPDTVPALPAEVVRTYGPFAPAPQGRGVAGVTFDGQRLWAATGTQLLGIDPASGETVRTLDCACDAGTAFDGKHLWQIVESRIDKLDAATGRVLASIPAPSASGSNSGLAWAEGSLWVGQYRDRAIRRIDPATGAVIATITSNRFVTGVTWVEGDLWHGTWEGGESDIRQIDPADGKVLQRLQLPEGTGVSGLESDGAGLLYAGSGPTGTVRAVRRPVAREQATGARA